MKRASGHNLVSFFTLLLLLINKTLAFSFLDPLGLFTKEDLSDEATVIEAKKVARVDLVPSDKSDISTNEFDSSFLIAGKLQKRST